jgi:hypothetical protein
VADFVPDSGRGEAIAALRRTYGLKFTLGNATSRLWHRLTRRSGDRHEIIRIRPASGTFGTESP